VLFHRFAISRFIVPQAEVPAYVGQLIIEPGRLERRDGVYILSVAQVGDTFVTQRLAGVTLSDTVYVGLFVCSHNATATERATFRNVHIATRPRRSAP